MCLEKHFERYPYLKETFWPDSTTIKNDTDNPHPLMTLVRGDSSRVKDVAIRTDKCVQLVKNANEAWLNAKAKIILEDMDYSNVSACLGEIRAYGELLYVWGDDIKARRSGSDFSFNLDGQTVNVEINTPQHRTKRYKMEHESVAEEHVKTKIFEIFPFGWPERNLDNIQGEAVSKLAAIKQGEQQFDIDSINILWVDLKDPLLWPLDFNASQFLPISAFREEITSGALWNALYAKKGTYIYDNLSIIGLPSNIYEMEYNGRFWDDSLLDFVVADTSTEQAVFQNPNRHTEIPDKFFRDIHHLFAFNMEKSWIDWPVRGKLTERIESELIRIQSYNDAFNIS